jgi:putative transposase
MTALLVLLLFPLGILLASRLLLPPQQFNRRRRGKVMKPPTRGVPKDDPGIKEEVLQVWSSVKNPTGDLVAHLFNRRNAHRGISISDSSVREMVRDNKERLSTIRKQRSRRPPHHVPWQLIWSADLTFRRDDTGEMHRIFCVVEHYSRVCVLLREVHSKSAITLLRCICDAVEIFGRPEMIRTDNEAQFLSRMFRFGLWWLGIRHDRIDPFTCYQNARVETFFSNLKRQLRQWPQAMRDLPTRLAEYRFWYNFVRPHQSLFGRTPAEVWKAHDIFSARPVEEAWFEGWDGHLAGPIFKPIEHPVGTDIPAPPERHYRPWSDEEDEILLRYLHDPVAISALDLPGRTPSAIQGRLTRVRKKAGLEHRAPWSAQEVRTLRENYATASSESLRRALPNRSRGAMIGKAKSLGLRCAVARGTANGKRDNGTVVDVAELPENLRHCYTMTAAGQFFEAVRKDLAISEIRIEVELVGRYATLRVGLDDADVTLPFGKMLTAGSPTKPKILRAVERSAFRIGTGRVRISAYTLIGGLIDHLSIADWVKVIRGRIHPLLQGIRGDAVIAYAEPTRRLPGGSPQADRRRISGEYDASDIDDLLGRIRSAAARPSRSRRPSARESPVATG